MRRLLPLVVGLGLIAACGGGTAVSPTPSSTTVANTATSTVTTTTSTTTSTTTVPETTTTTTFVSPFDTGPAEPVVVEPQFVLQLDGFEQLGVLGDPAEAVVGAFEEAFGDPTADSDWIDDHGCSFEGAMRTMVWIEPGVRLVFVDGASDVGTGRHLAEYSTVLPIDPPWEMQGIRREMTLDSVLEVFPEATLLPGPPLDYVQFVPGIASYAWLDAAGEIREFWAGTNYCRS